MSKLFSIIRSKPVFLILLPLFFVFRGFTENYNAVPLKDALLLLLLYVGATLFFFLVGWLFFRNILKAAILSFSIMAVHFLFGAIQDVLKSFFDDAFVTRYSFLVPFFILILILLIWFLRRTKKPMPRFNLYLNLLLGIFILVDATLLVQKMQHRNLSMNVQPHYNINCDTCTKPDIYFLVFDEYSSTAALKETWNYDNSDLDSFLIKKGFRVLSHSRSNYNFTQFSIASTLNMHYLNIPNPSACTIKDYNNCFELIKNNQVCSVLSSMGYEIANYSIFDIQKNPSLVTESFLPLKTKLITSQTFTSRIKKDLFHLLLVGKFELKWLSKDLIYATYHNNQKIINALLKDSSEIQNRPRFVYAHITMPHPPFYYNKYGQQKSKEDIIKDGEGILPYLDYLPKTNEVVQQIVNSILTRSKKPVAIVLVGDHGFRKEQSKDFQFRNLNAVYLSSGNYSGFHDSITNVNEYRILFNNLFNASLPLKKDSSIFLLDKQ
jgi:hypothetical protein